MSDTEPMRESGGQPTTGPPARLTLRLDEEARAALALLATSRGSWSEAVRTAILTAARLAPLVERLDRIERLLSEGERPIIAPTAQDTNGTAAADRTIAALGAWHMDDD